MADGSHQDHVGSEEHDAGSMPPPVAPRYRYRIDLQEPVACDGAAAAIESAMAALRACGSPASVEVVDAWFNVQLAAMVLTPSGDIIDVPF